MKRRMLSFISSMRSATLISASCSGARAASSRPALCRASSLCCCSTERLTSRARTSSNGSAPVGPSRGVTWRSMVRLQRQTRQAETAAGAAVEPEARRELRLLKAVWKGQKSGPSEFGRAEGVVEAAADGLAIAPRPEMRSWPSGF